MRTIPIKIREEMNSDRRYNRCMLSGPSVPPIEWHHPWQYGGSQIIDKWATVSISKHKHVMINNGNKELADEARKISLMMASDEDLAKYPKKDWIQERIRLACMVG